MEKQPNGYVLKALNLINRSLFFSYLLIFRMSSLFLCTISKQTEFHICLAIKQANQSVVR